MFFMKEGSGNPMKALREDAEFMPARTAVPRPPAPEAAISLANAKLYSDLQRSEAYLAEAQKLSLTGSLGWSISSDEHFWSNETFRIFEYDPSTKVTLQMILDRVHPEDLALVQQVMARAVNEKEFQCEYRLLMPSGIVKYVKVFAHSVQKEKDGHDFVGAVMDVTTAKRAEEELRKAQAQLAQMLEQEKTRLEAENTYLQEEIASENNFVEIVGNSPVLIGVLRQAEQIARTDSTVLILGETGTGKELVARIIHDRSPRKDRPLVKLNCGAIFGGLVDSELFGHIKGAFTGAIANREGRFKLADGGTIFLDEVGELPLDTQVKLLRVLQEQEFEPIGSSKTIKVNVRVVTATNRNLEELVRDGKFRADLFYRLNVVPVRVPTLRERRTDIPLLTTFFVQRYAKRFGKEIRAISDEAMRWLTDYAWPGNIRELQNIIERAVILSPSKTLVLAEQLQVTLAHTVNAALASPESAPIAPTRASDGSRDAVERRHIEAVLVQTNWLIEGERGAAKILNMNPSTLRSRMQRLNIRRPGAP
jgi:transcriptional regulator with GAF, ATPase, and Fis domain